MTPRGAARGTAPQSFGHFSVTGRTSRGPLLARRIHYTPPVCDPPTARVRLPSPQIQGIVSGVLSDSKKSEGNEEGDQLELVHLSKETISRKETSEVDEKLHPINWYHPACRTGSLFCAGPKGPQTAKAA